MHDFRYAGGKLYCEGVAVESLARKFGTPLYVYSQRTLTRHFEELDRAMGPVDHLVCFAAKSNSNLAMLRVLASLGSGFDIVSGGELKRIMAAGAIRAAASSPASARPKTKSSSPSDRAFIRSMPKASRNWSGSTGWRRA